MKAFVLTFSCVGLLGLPSAAAQPGPPPPAPPAPQEAGPVRSGFMIGVSLGAGVIVPSCDGCESESGVGFDFSIGGFISPTDAIMYDASAVSISEGNLNGLNVVNAIAWQRWHSSRLWTKAGIGFGRFIISDEDESVELESGLGVTGAVGYEFIQSTSFAVDGQFRLGNVFYDEINLTNVALMAGINWY